jgi:hypothetical protein
VIFYLLPRRVTSKNTKQTLRRLRMICNSSECILETRSLTKASKGYEYVSGVDLKVRHRCGVVRAGPGFRANRDPLRGRHLRRMCADFPPWFRRGIDGVSKSQEVAAFEPA